MIERGVMLQPSERSAYMPCEFALRHIGSLRVCLASPAMTYFTDT